ncbi:rhomboid family intramembrane serine protease GlpG [Catenovulum sediminis]|uniref:rhomboid family intramembrane serine protease GlpG n=1 Tax=Catenovulum sediminis TaxID=1740262 RepID=UPI001FE6B2A2|nr:rhomboid family intramembrane serine protease GlpG [Catenovulum sediminis]
MIHLARFADIRAAKAVSDYLQLNHIENHIQPENSDFHVYIRYEEQLSHAQYLLQEFIDNPHDEKFLDASWQLGQIEDITPDQQTTSSGFFATLRQQTGILTRIIGVLIVVVFIAQFIGFHPWIYQYLGFPISVNQLEITEIYRLFTPALMHGDWMHLIFNLFWWVWLAGRLELIKGANWLFNITCVTALTAHLLQYRMENAAFIGLSGVVYGLMGYAWIATKLNKLQLQIPNGIFVLMLLWLVAGFSGILGQQMANWAHLGGLISGMLWAYIEKRPAQSQA